MSRPSTKTRPSSVSGGNQAARSVIRFVLGAVAVFFAFAGITAARGGGAPEVVAIELVIALVAGAAAYLMGRH